MNIVLQFGQCGNQIGETLHECVYEDIQQHKRNRNKEYVKESLNCWFNLKHDKLYAKSILIDTETKVTDRLLANKKFKFENVVSSPLGGSANNWAFGYNLQSESIICDILEKVRREVERCDYVTCFFNILSSSGGTGAGVGSKTTEVLRDEFKTKFIVNAVVLPHKNGDVVTQAYNTLLTLTKLYDESDCILLFDNDRSYEICKKLSPGDVTFKDINQVISEHLASVMQPVKNFNFAKLVSNLCSHPSYKFVQISSAPFINKEIVHYEPKTTWSTLANEVFKISKRDVSNYKLRKVKSVGGVLVSRGNIMPSIIDVEPLTDASLYVPWVLDGHRFFHYWQRCGFMHREKFLSFVSNSNNVCHSIDVILENSWNLFTHGAYMHHYKKYNIDDEYFLEAFQKLENTLYSYKLL